MDEIREKFTFSMNSIKAYQLGIAQHGKIPEPSLPNTQGNHNASNHDSNESFFGGESKTMKEEIIKLQAVIIDIVGRVQCLEHRTLLQQQQRVAPVTTADRKRRGSAK